MEVTTTRLDPVAGNCLEPVEGNRLEPVETVMETTIITDLEASPIKP
jgi:hypothetical protein